MKTIRYCTAVSLAVSLALATAAEARGASPRDKIVFDIDAPSLVQALMQFTQQSGLQLMVPTDSATDAPAPKVAGSYTPTAALEQLLAGTALKYEFANARTVAIRVADSELRSRQSASSAESGAAPTSSLPSKNDEFPERGSVSTDSADAGSRTNRVSDRSIDQAPMASKKAIPEILVEGSRVMNVDIVRTESDAQPYTIMDAKSIQRSGATNVEDFLKQELTMNTVVQTNSQVRPTTSGTTSSINLRGLGTNETLILIDGRRSAGISFLGTAMQPDINGIPLSAVERIEVLPSSASAIYGGAAMGGVVNIVLKRNFEGGEFRYTYDRASSSNANQRTVGGNYGISFDQGRTQILVGGQYSDGDPIWLQDRQNLFNRGLAATLKNSPSYLFNESAPFPGATPNISSSTGSLTLKDGTPLNSPITSIPAGAGSKSDLSGALLANAGRYNLDLAAGTANFGLQSPFGTVPRTHSLFATVRQQLYGGASLFSEFSTSSNKSRAVQNPFSNIYFISSAAPNNPFQEDVLITFPSAVAALGSTDSVTKSATIGMVLPLSGSWSSEFDYTWSRNTFSFAFDIVDSDAFGSALNDGTVNPFVDTVANPLSLGAYLAPQSFSGSSTLRDVGLRASGSLVSLPAGSATLTVGLEHRKEGGGDSNFYVDYPLTTANTQQTKFFGQWQSTDSIYAEALVPLIAPSNGLAGVHTLGLQMAARSERYQVDAGTPYAIILPVAFRSLSPPQGVHSTIKYTSTNPTIGIKYEPLADIIVRASYATAFLPPTAAQLLADPSPVCGGSPCRSITDPVVGATYRINYSRGGNPSLDPQTSRNWDFGLIWAPQTDALRGLRANLEYYKITQPNYIVSPTPQQLVSDSSFSGRVTRNPTTGRVTTVDASYLNATNYKTSGWDFKVDYSKSTEIGTFAVRAGGTFIANDSRKVSIGAPFLEFGGYPNDGGEGKTKANAALSWAYHGWTSAWTTTYYSSYRQIGSPGSPTSLRSPTFTFPQPEAQGSNSIPSQTYHDIYWSYDFDKSSNTDSRPEKLLSNVTVQIGVKNVFNTLPPFDVNFEPYYYSPFGDIRLRSYRISVAKGF